ncbi:MAG TPA: efflux RND transporter periplasmic adaptor subunit [Polyangia bacterium]|jgi:RND family efflux transporter MFP subunit|nr:efflux RND transporter periplasmic adaptor subunit [Polyangia bacterium]
MRTLLVIILLSTLAFGVWKSARRIEANKRAAMFSAVAAAPPDKPDAVDAKPAASAPSGYLGVVLTGETVEIASKGEGRLEAVFAKAGDRVTRGETLAQLDVRTQREELAVAQAQLREARLRLARRIPLARGVGAISSEELSESRSAVLQSEARVRQLEQLVNEARVVAPFDGVIAARYLDVGSVVAPGRPIMRVIGKGDPKVRFAIPEDKVGEVTAGARVRVHVNTPSADFEGVIDSVSPEVDAGARLALGVVKLTLPPSWQGRLSTGQVAFVRPDRS